MLQNSLLVGVDHKKAPLDVREKFKKISLKGLTQSIPELSEAMLLSTCNRFELYSSMDELNDQKIIRTLAQHIDICPNFLESIAYTKRDQDMLRHGFRVAASLESMVVGEPQILGQMKQAYQGAKASGKIGGMMEKFCSTAFRVGKRVRTETALGKAKTSIASQAVEAMVQKIGDEGTVLVVGAGDMVKSALTHLMHYPELRVVLCNRTFPKAKELSARFSRVTAVCYEGLHAHLLKCDAVLSSTSAETPIFLYEDMCDVAENRELPLVMLDIAVPRDVEKTVADIPNIEVIDIDQLGQQVAGNVSCRQQQMAHANRIVEEEVAAFLSWSADRKNVHMVDHMRSYMEELRQEIFKQNPQVSADEATRLLMNKILHHPTLVLKSGEIPSEAVENALEILFGVSCPRVRLLPIRRKSSKKTHCPFAETKE